MAQWWAGPDWDHAFMKAVELGLAGIAADAEEADFGFCCGHCFCSIIRTGPSSPDSSRAVSLVNLRMLVRVRRCSLGRNWSPMMRLGQKLTTSISSSLPDGFTASVISTRNG